tara:strand:+ start:3892 stop:4743 length:852 start_codon:yes stop_codon:yes gene_type:complete
MSINSTGTPSSDEYLIGRGILYLAELNADGTPKSYKDVGNVPAMSLAVDSETFEHFSSRAGLKVLDMSAVIQQTANMSFTLENIQDFGNLKYFFSGDAQSYVNPAAAGFTTATLAAVGTILANSYYALVDGSGNPVFQLNPANLTVETTNATPVALTLDVDYTVDIFTGQIFLNNTAIVQTAISNSEGLTTDYTADAQAAPVDVLNAQTQTAITVAARFISEDANTGVKKIYDMHKVTISADGDYSLISDEVTQAPMAGAVEQSSYAGYDGTIDIYAPGERTA